MKNIAKTLIITAAYIIMCFSYQSPSTCTELYNYLTHSCQSCPNNTAPTSNKDFCNCSRPYYPNQQIIGFNDPSSCIQLTSYTDQHIISLYKKDGQYIPVQLNCSTDAYPNQNKTECIPCGFGMIYSTTINMCICSSATQYIIGQACFAPTTPPVTSFAIGSLQAQLYHKANVGCSQFQDHDSCQILLNQCSGNRYISNSFCDLLATIPSTNTNMPLSTFQDTYLAESLGIFASSKPGTDTTTVKNTLQFILFQYNVYGQLVDIKPMTKQILPCVASQEDVIRFQSFGLNLQKQCQTVDKNTVQPYYYDLFVLNSEGKYVPTPVRYPISNDILYRRFTWLTTSVRAIMTFNSAPPLTIPVLNYTESDLNQMSTSSTTTSINLTLLAPFIIFNIGILIVFISNFYKHIKYNPDEINDTYYVLKAILIFILMAMKHWGIGLWIFLFGLTSYIFCFFKFQQTVYLLLPDYQTQYYQYYGPFLSVFYAQFSFVLVSFFFLTYNLAMSTDYFLIDWEKQKDLSNFDIKMGQQKKHVSVWRKVLLVNELYELTISQVINVQFVALFSLVFLQGLDWVHLSYQIPNTFHLQNNGSISSVINIVLGYFIVTFIVFIIAIIQFIFRHLIKIWSPMPYEDFVDLCSICNISLIVFDQSLHGYYLHGINPLGQAQGSLQYIDSVFQKQARSFGKSRAFQNDDPDKVQIFQVSFPSQIRHTFQIKYKNRYNQKLIGASTFAKPIPEMMNENDYKQLQTIHNDMFESFKYYLEAIKTSQFNIKDRGFVGKFFSCPNSDDLTGRLPIFYKDFWHEFTNVLMSGHQIVILINTINFINIFFLATQNIFMSIFITMFITRILKKINNQMIKKNISRNTLIDDKFFN